MNEIEIRNMIESDIDFITHANKEVHEASKQTGEIIEFKERLKKDVIYDNPKANVIVATQNENPLGMALYSTVYFADEGEIMWISNIFVENEYRNKGIAKAMMSHLKQVCKDKGYYAICGAVENSNENSKNFCNSINGKWLENFKIVVIK